MKKEALAALISRMPQAEARTDAPPDTERGDWLYSGVGPLEFTKADANCWMAIIPALRRAWVPRALVFWQEMMRSGLPTSPELAEHPAHSLARWPTIEEAVRVYMAASRSPEAQARSA